MTEFKCRVCGFQYDTPTWYDFNEPSGDICICCGVEFGFDDTDYESVIDYRKEWIKNGAVFHILKLKPAEYKFDISDIMEKWK